MKGPDKKFYIIRRNDKKFGGSEIDIPADALFSTLRVHPTWEVVEEVNEDNRPTTSISIKEAPKSNELECPLCGRTFKSERAIKIHKKTHL